MRAGNTVDKIAAGQKVHCRTLVRTDHMAKTLILQTSATINLLMIPPVSMRGPLAHNGEVSDGGGPQARGFADAPRPPPFAPPKS